MRSFIDASGGQVPVLPLTIAVVRRPGPGSRAAWPDVARPAEAWSGETWDVVCLCDQRGAEVGQPLASFGHRGHAEAFLEDLLAAATTAGCGHGSGPS